MARKQALSSRSLVAVFVTAALSMSAGAALAGAVPQAAQDQTSASSSSTMTHRTSPLARAKGDMAAKRSLGQIDKQLKSQDKQMKAANTELNQSRERLARTTQKLKQAQANETHVARAERRTTKKERQEDRNLPQRSGEQSSASSSTVPR